MNTNAAALNEGITDQVANRISAIFSRTQPRQIGEQVAAVKKRDQNLENLLRAKGVDIGKIRSRAEAAGKATAAKIASLNESTTVLGEDAAVAMAETVQQSFVECFTGIYDDLSKEGELEEGLTVFVGVLVAQIFAMALITALTVAAGVGLVNAVAIGNIMCAVFVAPVTEEYGRRYALQSGKGLAGYLAILNVWEFVGYVSGMLNAGVSLTKAIGLRVLCAIIHQFYAALQKFGYVRDVTKGMTPEEAGRFEFYVSMALHGLWNGGAVAFGIAQAVKRK